MYRIFSNTHISPFGRKHTIKNKNIDFSYITYLIDTYREYFLKYVSILIILMIFLIDNFYSCLHIRFFSIFDGYFLLITPAWTLFYRLELSARKVLAKFYLLRGLAGSQCAR
jgi:hypothetical protein